MLMFLFLYTEKAVPVRDTTTQVQKIIVLIILIAHLVDITESSLFLMYHVWAILSNTFWNTVFGLSDTKDAAIIKNGRNRPKMCF